MVVEKVIRSFKHSGGEFYGSAHGVLNLCFLLPSKVDWVNITQRLFRLCNSIGSFSTLLGKSIGFVCFYFLFHIFYKVAIGVSITWALSSSGGSIFPNIRL